ncbi:class I SAM-dependent methyltransferase [Kibdelosporangium aridum]|uniref:Methyltransferase domain-containing protein n=1 Tax=Kibdelosporangium aridum TaxID=2030 RepID=A0A1W2FWI3_KIBAR|nr:class I SAM-dependent methyltransferase [Kibdelosporangium aridum]SMD25958.1 Methyltransferase domain-containing protein [Kibdelosporangium aridum]
MTLSSCAHDPDPAAVVAVARTWNARAARYDQYYRSYAEAGRDAWRRLYRDAINALLGPEPRRVLDVGTGTGFAAVLLAELGHDVTGMDASKQMLERAHEEATRRSVTVEWCHGDGHDVPIASYDLVTCRYVLWTLPAPGAALSSWARALRPGGAVLVADGRWHTARQLLRSPRLIPGAVRDYLAMGRTLPYWKGITATQMTTLLSTAGFGTPRPFGHLLPGQVRRDSRDFFVVGAQREG